MFVDIREEGSGVIIVDGSGGVAAVGVWVLVVAVGVVAVVVSSLAGLEADSRASTIASPSSSFPVSRSCISNASIVVSLSIAMKMVLELDLDLVFEAEDGG